MKICIPVPSGQVQNVKRISLTATTVTFAWDPPECETRHGEFVGFAYEVRDSSKLGSIVQHAMLNTTTALLEDLVPHTNYIFQVWFINHINAGPKSEPQDFRTLEDSECRLPVSGVNFNTRPKLQMESLISY